MDSRIVGLALSISLGQLSVACATTAASTGGSNLSPSERAATDHAPKGEDDAAMVPASAARAPVDATATDSDTDSPPAATDTPFPALPQRTRIELMTGRETAYLIDYENSGTLALDRTNCTPKPEVKPESKRAPEPTSLEEARAADEAALEAQQQKEAEQERQFNECMKKARSKFSADVVRFRRDGLGHIQMVFFRRNGSALIELNVSNVELTESGNNAIKVSVKASVAGQRPILRDRNQFELRMPNPYTLEIQDPVYGQLIYNEKVGLVAN
jgi:hypothetical protein